MEAGKQQVNPVAEIQPAFRDLDIGQLASAGQNADCWKSIGLAVNSYPSSGKC